MFLQHAPFVPLNTETDQDDLAEWQTSWIVDAVRTSPGIEQESKAYNPITDGVAPGNSHIGI